jgi:hypothetical protein
MLVAEPHRLESVCSFGDDGEPRGFEQAAQPASHDAVIVS